MSCFLRLMYRLVGTLLQDYPVILDSISCRQGKFSTSASHLALQTIWLNGSEDLGYL